MEAKIAENGNLVEEVVDSHNGRWLVIVRRVTAALDSRRKD